MVTITASERQAEVLRDVHDFWLEAMEDATKQVEGDRSIDSADDLLRQMAGMYELHDDAVDLKEMLRRALAEPPRRPRTGEVN